MKKEVKKNINNKKERKNVDKKENKETKFLFAINSLKKEKKRLLAEIVNKQEQWNKEKIEISKYCNQDLIHNLIEILNNFEISLKFKVKEEETKRFLKGIELIWSSLEKKMKEYGLTKIEIKKGDIFNEKYHEVLEIKYNKNFKEKEILEIKQSGYKLYDRVLQPVKIILNEKKEKGTNKNE